MPHLTQNQGLSKQELSSAHACRPQCAACCIAPSISAATPKHPQGKAAGVRCGHLTQHLLCELFDSPLRPATCKKFHFDIEVCQQDAASALKVLETWEILTKPSSANL
nr:hypothetical protein [Allopseudospirillum japonicum]